MQNIYLKSKRLIAFIMAVLMTVSLIPQNVIAEELIDLSDVNYSENENINGFAGYLGVSDNHIVFHPGMGHFTEEAWALQDQYNYSEVERIVFKLDDEGKILFNHENEDWRWPVPPEDKVFLGWSSSQDKYTDPKYDLPFGVIPGTGCVDMWSWYVDKLPKPDVRVLQTTKTGIKASIYIENEEYRNYFDNRHFIVTYYMTSKSKIVGGSDTPNENGFYTCEGQQVLSYRDYDGWEYHDKPIPLKEIPVFESQVAQNTDVNINFSFYTVEDSQPVIASDYSNVIGMSAEGSGLKTVTFVPEKTEGEGKPTIKTFSVGPKSIKFIAEYDSFSVSVPENVRATNVYIVPKYELISERNIFNDVSAPSSDGKYHKEVRDSKGKEIRAGYNSRTGLIRKGNISATFDSYSIFNGEFLNNLANKNKETIDEVTMKVSYEIQYNSTSIFDSPVTYETVYFPRVIKSGIALDGRATTTKKAINARYTFNKDNLPALKEGERYDLLFYATAKAKLKGCEPEDKDEDGFFNYSERIKLTNEDIQNGYKDVSVEIFDEDVVKPVEVIISASLNMYKNDGKSLIGKGGNSGDVALLFGIATIENVSNISFDNKDGKSLNMNVTVPALNLPADVQFDSTKDAYVVRFEIKSAMMMKNGSKTPDDDGFFSYSGFVDASDIREAGGQRQVSVTLFASEAEYDTDVYVTARTYVISKIGSKLQIKSDFSNVVAAGDTASAKEYATTIVPSVNDVSAIKVTGAKAGDTVTQTAYSSKDYKITVTPATFNVPIEVTIKDDNGVDVTEKCADLSPDYSKLTITTFEANKNLNVTISARNKGTAIADYTFIVKPNAVNIAKPAAKVEYSSDSEVGIVIKKNNKLTIPNNGLYQYEAIVKKGEETISSNSIDVNYIDLEQDLIVDISKAPLDTKLDVYVKVNHVVDGVVVNSSPEVILSTNKKAEKYPTQLGLTVKKSEIYIGQEDVIIAKGKFKPDATHFLDSKIDVVRVGTSSGDIDEDNLELPKAKLSDNERNIVLSVSENVIPGKYKITAYASAEPGTEVSNSMKKTITVNIKYGSLGYSVSANTTKLYKADNKKQTLKLKYCVPTGVKNQTKWEIIPVSGNSTYRNRVTKYVKVSKGVVTVAPKYRVSTEHDYFKVRVSGMNYKGEMVSAESEVIELVSDYTAIGGVVIADESGNLYSDKISYTDDEGHTVIPKEISFVKGSNSKYKVVILKKFDRSKANLSDYEESDVLDISGYTVALSKNFEIDSDDADFFNIVKKGTGKITVTANDRCGQKGQLSIKLKEVVEDE